MIILIILIILVLLSFSLFRNLFKNDVTILDDVKLKEEEPSNNGFALMLQKDDGTYEQSISSTWPTGMVFNSELSGCIDVNGNKIDNALSFDSTNNLVNVSVGETAYCYLYFDKDNSVYAKVVSDYKNNNGVSKLSDSDKGSRTYDTYYYTGNITNNNVLYADHCWKMVITTEGNGVKMIYNGNAYHYTSFDKISESEYNVSTNTPSSYPFTYDSNTNEWTSGIAGQNSTTNTIEFTVSTAGDYVLNYSVSSESGFDVASFYKNGTALESNIGGIVNGSIDLSGLTTSDVIKVTYTKDEYDASGSDTVTFSISKPTGEKTLSCDNTGDDVTIGGSAFNFNDNSPAYAGYMYNKVYIATYKNMSSNTIEYVYGKNFDYNKDTNTYTLNTTMTSSSWSSIYSSGLNSYHYTCFNTSGTCTNLHYIYYTSSSYAYYITLTGEKSVEDALNEMLYAEDVNTADSTIKAEIDSWYESNLLNTQDSEGNLYSSYLQNTIYCNNRAMSNEKSNGWYYDGGSTRTLMYFNYSSLDCENVRDQFTLSVDNGGTNGYGNNALKYPIGLISYKEASLATASGYLDNDSYYWLLSPFYFDIDYPIGWGVYRGTLADIGVNSAIVGSSDGVRPALTLSNNVEITIGDGSVSSPYQVKLS